MKVEVDKRVGSEWPKDRFVFAADDGGYIFCKHHRVCIVINGVDHVRIICKIVDNDLNQAYKRLAELHNLIGEKLEYASDPKAGFLVSLPTEIGAGRFAIEVETKEGEKFSARTLHGSSIVQNVNSVLKELANALK